MYESYKIYLKSLKFDIPNPLILTNVEVTINLRQAYSSCLVVFTGIT
jgi:hypothetical protein